MTFFENSIYKLKNGGHYICEDLTNKTIENFEKIISNLKTKHQNCNFTIEKIKHQYNHNDNNLLIVYKSQVAI